MLRDSAKAAISLVAPAATFFLMRLYVGRTLGEEALGIYSLTWAVYSFALLAATLGIGSGLTRYVAQLGGSHRRQSRILVVGLVQALTTATVVAVILAAIARPMSSILFGIEQLPALLLCAAVVLPGAATGKAVLGFLNGQNRLGMYALISVVQSAAVVLCTVSLVRLGLGLRGAVFGLLVPIGAVGLASLGTLTAALRPGIERPRGIPISRGLLTFGLMVTLTNGVGLVQGYTDTLMIGAYLGERELGSYAAALLALQFIGFPGHVVQLAMTPRFAAQWGKGAIDGIGRTLDRTLSTTAVVVLPLAFSVALGSRLLLGLVFGYGFDDTAGVLVWLVPGAVAIGLWASVGTVLSSTGHVRIALKLSLLSAVVNVLLNAALIPALGIRGAAVSTSASLLLGCALQAYVVQRRLGVKLRWKRPALAVLLLALVAGVLLLTGRSARTVPAVALCWVGASVFCAAALPEARLRPVVWSSLQTTFGRHHGRHRDVRKPEQTRS